MRWWHDVSVCVCVYVCALLCVWERERKRQRLLKWKRGKEKKKKAPCYDYKTHKFCGHPMTKLFNKEKVARYRLSFVAELSLTARAGKTNLRYSTHHLGLSAVANSLPHTLTVAMWQTPQYTVWLLDLADHDIISSN